MAFKHSASLLLLLLLPIFLLDPVAGSHHHHGSIGVYWGQITDEGSLADTCNTGNYAFVMLASLSTFGGGQMPRLNLAKHCNPDDGSCARLSTEIKGCQAKGIKVFLSIGGAGGNYTLASDWDAVMVAFYLHHNFLGGGSPYRPLGDAVLDGIDFDIKTGGTQHYEQLAMLLRELGGGKVYLSATPQCSFPDYYLGTAIKAGVFDYIWVQFFNNPTCEYSRDVDHLIRAWKQWAGMPVKLVFLDLPAAPEVAKSGYIPPDVLVSEVLPAIEKSPKYGGIMLWSRYYDMKNGYSTAVLKGRTTWNSGFGREAILRFI